MSTAEIVVGAAAGYTTLVVNAAVPSGTIVVVYRGGLWIGQGAVVNGVASVTVQPLAQGDIIQASVTQRGNQAGIPQIVGPADLVPTGWLKPSAVAVTGADGTSNTYSASQYETTFGEKLGSVYDPESAGLTRRPEEYEPGTQPELGFDVVQTKQPGQTTLQVVARGGETLLTGWNGAGLSANAPLTLTEGGTVSVTVKRDDSPTTLTRTLSVTVLPGSGSAPSGGDITGYSFRLFDTAGGYLVRLNINSAKAVEARLEPFASTYAAGSFYGSQYQEVSFSVVGPGTYTAIIRVVGDTNAANYKSIVLTI